MTKRMPKQLTIDNKITWNSNFFFVIEDNLEGWLVSARRLDAA